jgi:hypothetical protein
MAACVMAVQQADGTLVLQLDPTAQDLTACAYVVESGAELSNSFLTMTASDGATYGGEVVAVWMAAFAIRVIARVIKQGSATNE